MSVFETTYYGNTLLQWAIAFGLILASFVVGRVLYWVFGRYIKKLTARSKTEIDDILIDKLEEPVVALLVIFGTRWALGTLNFSAEIRTTIANLFIMLIALIITWAILRFYEAMHTSYITNLVAKSETDLDDQLLPILRSGVRIIVIALGIIVGLNNAGYDVGAVLAGLGIGGLAFALAAQDTVANFFGGVMLFVQRPFQLNDRIEVNGIKGYIREIGLRSSRIETLYEEMVIVPNKLFTESPIINYATAHYFEKTILEIHRATPPDKLRQVVDEINQLATDNPRLAWVACVFTRAVGTHHELLVKFGVTTWDPISEASFGDYFGKINRVRTNIHFSLLEILQAQHVKLALPLEVRMNGEQFETHYLGRDYAVSQSSNGLHPINHE